MGYTSIGTAPPLSAHMLIHVHTHTYRSAMNEILGCPQLSHRLNVNIKLNINNAGLFISQVWQSSFFSHSYSSLSANDIHWYWGTCMELSVQDDTHINENFYFFRIHTGGSTSLIQRLTTKGVSELFSSSIHIIFAYISLLQLRNLFTYAWYNPRLEFIHSHSGIRVIQNIVHSVVLQSTDSLLL
jgi:hypothetical protein